MKFLKIKIGLKYMCCWILLLQLINLSIDPARHGNYIDGKFTFQEDLSINKIESVYELVAEYFFKKDVPEAQNADTHSLVKSFIMFHQVPAATEQLILAEEPIVHNHSYQAAIPKFIQILESPPPKV
jgi:glycogen synthase